MTLPTVGGDTNVWGGYINSDLTILDNIFPTAGTGTSVGLNVGSGKTLTVAGTLTATGTVTLPTTTSITNATYNILTISGNGSTVTLTFNQPDVIVIGTQITIAGVSPSGFNGVFTSTTSSSGSVSYASAQTGSGTGGTIYYPLAIATTSSAQTLTGKTLQDPVINGTLSGTYSIAGTPTLTSALTSSADVTFKKASPILTLNNLTQSFGYRLNAQITASTDSGLVFQQYTAGPGWQNSFTVNPDLGLTVGGPSGGSKGVGTVNATAYYTNGALAPITQTYVSTATVNMTANTTLTFSHGLGAVPEVISYTLTCTTADAGYVVGEKIQIPLNNGESYKSTDYGYTTLVSSSTITITVVNGGGPIVIVNKTTRALAALTESSWTLVVQAYV